MPRGFRMPAEHPIVQRYLTRTGYPDGIDGERIPQAVASG